MGAGDFGLAESSVIHFLLCEGLEICERLILAMVFLVKRFRDHLYIFRGDLTALAGLRRGAGIHHRSGPGATFSLPHVDVMGRWYAPPRWVSYS
jgi:hypothetical protein